MATRPNRRFSRRLRAGAIGLAALAGPAAAAAPADAEEATELTGTDVPTDQPGTPPAADTSETTGGDVPDTGATDPADDEPDTGGPVATDTPTTTTEQPAPEQPEPTTPTPPSQAKPAPASPAAPVVSPAVPVARQPAPAPAADAQAPRDAVHRDRNIVIRAPAAPRTAPARPVVAKPADTPATPPRRAATARISGDPSAAAPRPAAADSPRRERVEHTVESGETLWSIASRLVGPGADSARIAREVNRLWVLNAGTTIRTGDPGLLPVGTVLRLH